jgi:ABC-type sugar transport system substrate-binding protein
MKMLSRVSIVAALVAVAALCASACNRATTNGSKRPVVGVSLLTETHAFYKELEDGLREEAAARGLDLVIVACEMDPAKQAAQIEDFVAERVSAILVAPCDSSAIGAHLAGPARAHIPVFSADIAVRGGPVVSHVASDNVQGGRLAAKTLAHLIGDKGRVLVLDQPEVASVQDRVRGFDEEMKNHPGIAVVGHPSGAGQRATAMAVMEDMLQAHRDLNGVFGINDDSALGAAAVIEAAGRKDIVVVGYDATPEAQAAITRGSPLKADVVQYPRRIGKTAIDIIARYLKGETVEPLVAIDVGVVDAAALGRQ